MNDRRDWMWCDGQGNDSKSGKPSPRARRGAFTEFDEPFITRRQILVSGALAGVWWAGSRSALAEISVDKAATGDVLVSVFLRGGADGLSVVVPHGEDAYYALRPSLAIPAPKAGMGESAKAVDLDGFFGLHPALAPLLPLFREGRMAAVHAAGSGDQTRSHFEAMSAMERGLGGATEGDASGWLARHLASASGGGRSPLRAVALGGTMPDSLRGATDATALNSLAEYRLQPGSNGRGSLMRTALTKLYERKDDLVSEAGFETLQVLETLNRLQPSQYKPSGGAAYPESDLGRGLRETAFLIKSGIGLEVACLDKGGWDSHVTQGSTTGWLASLLEDLGKSLAAFAADLGPSLERVSVVVQTEFGRRAYENRGLGTDHGRAGVMFLLGGGVNGGRVFGKWPGLGREQLEEPGDLRVTTDYRDVLGELLQRRLPGSDVSKVFQAHTVVPLDLCKPI